MKQFKFWTIAALCAAAFAAAFACFDVEPGTFVDYESATLTGGEGYTIDVLLPEWTNQQEYESKLEELKKQNGNEQFAGVAVTGTPFTLNLAFSGFVNEQGAQVIEADDPIVEMSIWYWKKNGGENGSTGQWTELKKIENPQFEVEGSEPLALFGRGTIPDAMGCDTEKGEYLRVVFYFKSKGNKETFKMDTFKTKLTDINAPKEVKAPVLLIVPLDNTLPEY